MKTLAFLVSIVLLTAAGAATGQVPNRADATAKPRCPGENRILVLGGGGVRGAYQIGALWYLIHEMKCDFAYYVGTSTGAVSAAYLSQAKSHADLEERIGVLVADYQGLTDESQLLHTVPLGSLRVFAPRWLFGVDGVNTLDPLVKKLAARLGDAPSNPSNFRAPVVSLQTGNLDAYELDSFLDRVVGSASIPLAVEPRLTRVWTTAYIGEIQGDRVELASNQPPGIADPRCALKLADQAPIRCRHISTHERLGENAQVGENTIVGNGWRMLLEVPDRGELQRIVDFKKRNWSSPQAVKFTAVHQLVDGGVTDNLPLGIALDVSYNEKRFDSIFALTTGESINAADPNAPVHGGKDILLRSFERLWQTYQERSLDSYWVGPMAGYFLVDSMEWMQEARAWADKLRTTLGEAEFSKLEARMGAAFPKRTPNALLEPKLLDALNDKAYPPTIYLIEPTEKFFTQTFEVAPEKIAKALRHGCRLAANFFDPAAAVERIGNLVRYDRWLREEVGRSCDRFEASEPRG